MVSKAPHIDYGNGERAAERASASPGMGKTLAALALDVLSLGELQFKLLLLDAASAIKRSKMAVALVIAGTVTALGAIPVVLGGVAYLLSLLVPQLTVGGWAVLVGLVAIGGGVGLLYWGKERLLKAAATFDHSRAEFFANFESLKSALRNQRR